MVSSGTRWRLNVGPAWIAFPLLVISVVMVLTALDINGSSVGVLTPTSVADPSLLAGTPRGIRTDETLISTPNIVGNVRRGLPDQPWIGLTPTYLPATGIGVPSIHWTEAFKPQDWSFAVLGVARGFTLHWWSQVAIALLGLFALLAALTRRGWSAAGLAAIGVFTPYVAWWSLTPGLTLGYLSGACALTVWALRARSPGQAVLLGLGAGYLTVAAFLLLYPPWLVSVGWVVAGIVVGAAIDARVRVRRMLIVAGSFVVTLLPSVAVWYAQGVPAIAAQADTYYPGGRMSQGGEGVLPWLFSAPANPWVAAVPSAALGGPTLNTLGGQAFSNQSEQASVWFPLPTLVVLLVAVLVASRGASRAATLVRVGPVADEVASTTEGEVPTETYHTTDVELEDHIRTASPPLFWTTIGTTCSLVVLLAWTLLPMPSWFGAITLLTRVPGPRTSLALGLGATVLMAIGVVVLGRTRKSWPWVGVWVLAGAITTWATTWAGHELGWRPLSQQPNWQLLVVSAFFATAFTLLAWRRAAPYAIAALLVGSIASWVLVNPWYVGLGPLVTDPVVRALEPLAKGEHVARVAVFGSEPLTALVQASGVEMLSGVTVYPDASVWDSLAPTQRDLWNNYVKYQWVESSDLAQAAVIVPVIGTRMKLIINPCARTTLALHVDWAISSHPLVGYSCLLPYDIIKRGRGQVVYQYKVIDPVPVASTN